MPQASSLNEARVAAHLASLDFAGLFVGELGWSNPRRPEPFALDADGASFTLTEIAQLSGVGVFEAIAADGAAGGTQARRSALRRELARLHAENLLVFVDAGRSQSVWHWANREVGADGKVATKVFEEAFARGQSPDRLRAALDAMVFDVADFEEGDPSIVEVTRRLRRGLKVEEVTKRFFRQFADERRAFAKFIAGLGAEGQRGEYTAVLLDRLMFCYFLQHKGFLGDGDTRYLRHALERSQNQGRDRFYAGFLRPLFFDGFARREDRRDDDTKKILGQVPYLNGGLFEPHRIERDAEANGRTLAVPDAAFEKLFAFFDEWRWTLDTRPLRSGREINPDVLGYIFEQFINYQERKEKGSYYTKEDVTGYIARSTLLPWWLDRAAELAGDKPDTKAAKPLDLFAPGGPAHALLTTSPARYLWREVTKGVLDDAGREIAAPGDWSVPATADEAAGHPFALATETRLEFDARRRRCLETLARVAAGGVASADDLVTLNLDLPTLCRDLIDAADAPLTAAMARALDGLTVLDPTCGSGAFLFAALNLLDPLAAAVDARMRQHLAAGDLDPDLRHNFATRLRPADGSVAPEGYRRLKRLVAGNLFGVDLMPEATEICKLRLFLRLVAELDDPRHVEPLPDIDFNVRRGNTLVGLATPADLRQSVFGTEEYDAIERGLTAAGRHLFAFRHAQAIGVEAREHKENYRLTLRIVADKLDGRLYVEQAPRGMSRDAFVATRRPFHWPAEFHDIMAAGGFACVIGNPPYVAAAGVDYLSDKQRAHKFPDIYALVMLRVLDVMHPRGRAGLIVPLNLTFSGDFGGLRVRLAERGTHWFSSYDNIPGAIFEGVSQRCTIWLGHPHGRPENRQIRVAPMHRWRTAYRPALMGNVSYMPWEPSVTGGRSLRELGLPKLSDPALHALLRRFAQPEGQTRRPIYKWRGRESFGFSPSARNFMSVFGEQPPSVDVDSLQTTPPAKAAELSVASEEVILPSLAVLVGEVSFWHWLVTGDGFHVTSGNVRDVLTATEHVSDEHFDLLGRVGEQLHRRRNEALQFKKNAGKYVGNFNYRGMPELTRRADLLLLSGIGASAADARAVFTYVQRVLAINESAGEKGIPPEVKSQFPPKPVDYAVQSELFSAVDEVLRRELSFGQQEIDDLLLAGLDSTEIVDD